MIYAIRAVGTEYIKFGYSAESNLDRRLCHLQIGCPFTLEILACGIGSELDESEIHYKLKCAGKWHRGEWFILSPEVEEAIEWIKSRKKKPKAFPKLKQTKSRRLARVLEYTVSNPIETHQEAKKELARLRSGWRAYQQPSYPQSSTEQSKTTEEASQFMQSLMTWESSTLRSTDNS